MIRILDDFLPEAYANAIHYSCLYDLKYVYNSQTSVSYGDEPVYNDSNVHDNGQMVSILYAFSNNGQQQVEPFYGEIKPMIYTLQSKVPDLDIQGIIRVKANLILRERSLPQYHYNVPHQDAKEGCMSLIYYVCDSDGDTFFFNEKYSSGGLPDKVTVHQRVQPKRNRAILFDSSRYHASSNPLIHKERIVLNFVMKATYANN